MKQGRESRGGARLLIILGLVASLVPAADFAGGQTSRPRGIMTTAFAQTTPPPTPTPIVVPQLPPAPSQQQQQQQRPTPTPAPAAKPEALDDDDDVVRVSSNLVVVPASVVDAAGQPVLGLKREDFRLEEEGRAQEIAAVGDAEQVPLDIALLFDVSSSAKEEFAFQQEAAARFLKQVLKPIDRAAVFTISNKPEMQQALASADVTTAKIRSIPPITTKTATAFYDSVRAAAKYLAANAPERNRRVILVISDGEDNYSDQIRDAASDEATVIVGGGTLKERDKIKQSQLHQKVVGNVLRDVQRADAVFYSINPTGPSLRLNDISTRAQNGMQQMAETTGGNAFVPAKLQDLESIFNQIAAELRAQYLIQYQSNAEAAPGKYLKINVTTPARTGLTIRARQGYYKK